FTVRVYRGHHHALSVIVPKLLSQFGSEILYLEPQPSWFLRLLASACRRLLSRQFPQRRGQFLFFVLSEELHSDLRPRSRHGHDITQLPRVLHGVTIQGHNHITALEARLGCWGTL